MKQDGWGGNGVDAGKGYFDKTTTGSLANDGGAESVFGRKVSGGR
jgi:hypothetical protein